MKKLLAVVLAAAMALSLGVVAFAASADFEIPLSAAQIIEGSKNTNEMNPDDDVFFKLAGMVKVTVPVVFFNEDGEAQPAVDTEVILNASEFTDKDLYKVKFDKGDDNTKMISKMALTEDKKDVDGNKSNRGPWLKVSVKPVYDDTEYKIAPSMTLTTKEGATAVETAATGRTVVLAEGIKIQINCPTVYINNSVDLADQDYSAGDGGVVLKPTKNDDNEITWEDENNTIATLKFMGDDNQTKFFPKLSTKWEDADYAEYFADQDAFIFNFKGSVAGQTKISSTSRATLELYNPYYDVDEDEYTVEPENCVIYMVGDDGSLNDVTASFKAIENEDGDYVFQTKTRELGVYIIAEKAYTTAAAEDVETPDDGKAIPDTGIWA